MKNIVATFDDPNSARLAMTRLQEAGIPPARIRYNPSPDTEFLQHAGPSQPRPGHAGYYRQGFLESIGGFFANLIESHTDESGIYSEALHRGTTLVLVETEQGEVSRVVHLLQDYGAMSLEDRVSRWRCEGWQPGNCAEGSIPAGSAGASVGTVPVSAAGTHAASPSQTGSVVSPARAGTGGAAETLRGGPVGTQSLTGGGAAVGMPTPAGTEVGGAGARRDGSDLADTGGDPTLPSSHTLPTAGEAGRLHERAVPSDGRAEPSVRDRGSRS